MHALHYRRLPTPDHTHHTHHLRSQQSQTNDLEALSQREGLYRLLLCVEVREGCVGNSEAKFKHVFGLNVWTLMDEAR
ncbi:uncharacterized protein Bfra_011378 [Botrytis fragariae]|uniref:Uncharacterized protein n=1 Tax=Botrytis fragariae TaxID=1964551 RepID=A0A8H6AXX7_9HELO|nr:uncharacterized protein Bfra_011378 [Botrytis fragariae]KAF5875616.1 hypothetical protein Bfra_011378 [Botrytis fragariae]